VASSSLAVPAARRAKRDLVGAASIMMGAFVLSRATGLLRTVVVSAAFGTGPEMDAYVAAIFLPDLIFQIVAGGAVASAFIPVLSSYLAKEDAEGAWRLVSSLFSLALVLLLPICLLLGVFAPQVLGVLVSGYTPEQVRLAASLTRILLGSPIFFALGTLTTSVLNAHQRFLLAALAPTTYNLGIILGAALLARPLGIYGLAVGAATGALGFLLIQLPGLVRCGLVFRPRLGLDDPGVRQVARLVGPRTVGLAVAQVNFGAIIALASPIPGAVTALNYAWTLMMLPLGVFAMAISTAVFPTLAEQTARDQLDEMRSTLSATLRVILYLTIPASIGLMVLAEPIVRLLLERGQFGPASTALTVYALRFYALGLIGQAAVEIVTRAFYALHDTRTPVIVAVIAMVANLSLALLLRPSLGHGGLALALATASGVEAALLLVVARRRLGGIDDARLAASTIRSLAGAGALALVLAPVVRALQFVLGQTTLADRLVFVGVAVALGTIVYASATIMLRAEEPMRVIAMVRGRLGRPPC
jgi:putative peptidoglycan lipid II flippase